MEVIKFNPKIYKQKAIKQAISDYKDLAKFDFVENNNYIEVHINKVDKDYQDIIKNEFANYVLGLMS